jgi:hypothetical protein
MALPVRIYSTCDYIQIEVRGKPPRKNLFARGKRRRVAPSHSDLPATLARFFDEKIFGTVFASKVRTERVACAQLALEKFCADIATLVAFSGMPYTSLAHACNCRGTPTAMCLSS